MILKYRQLFIRLLKENEIYSKYRRKIGKMIPSDYINLLLTKDMCEIKRKYSITNLTYFWTGMLIDCGYANTVSNIFEDFLREKGLYERFFDNFNSSDGLSYRIDNENKETWQEYLNSHVKERTVSWLIQDAFLFDDDRDIDWADIDDAWFKFYVEKLI
mgnify:CR=1 FL=1